MRIIALVQEAVARALSAQAGALVISPKDVQVEFTQDASHGEITTNAAMTFAKRLGVAPRVLASALVEEIRPLANITHVEIAGPGFINITLTSDVWLAELATIVRSGPAYAASEMGGGELVHVEFVSANPTGPMHAGHVRNAVLGDAIASLLAKVGYKVYREYYINDAGGQVECLARSVYLRYQEALGTPISPNAFDGNLYPGIYLMPVGTAIARSDGEKWKDLDEAVWLPVFKVRAVEEMMKIIQHDLHELGVVMDCYTSEKALTEAGKVQKAIDVLQSQDDVYEGVLEQPKGHTIDDWESRPQLLFRATKYGDETDRPLRKSDGSWTYFAGDIAYHLDKFRRGFRNMVSVLGADHCGYVKRLTAAVSAITQGRGALEVKLFQIVNFFEHGQPVKMSKRAGTFITSEDIVSRVGKDATRFMMVSRHNSTIIDFDFEKVLEQSQDNPLFYIQYAYARICSVFRHVAEAFEGLTRESIATNPPEGAIAHLTHQSEIGIIRLLASWPKIVEQAASAREPHRITNYLYTLAGAFHNLWNQGKGTLELRFIDRNSRTITEAKLFLLCGVASILNDGLELLGITPVEEMR